jgi:O-antigen/teichoic acid export membrane protein
VNSRIGNAKRNIMFGALNRLVNIIIPFIIRTMIIIYLGEEYLGLNALYASILQVLSLTELGFATAISASMYKPIAEGDTKTVSALLRLYRNIYRVIGIGILIFSIMIIPFLPNLINGQPPEDINIYLLFILYVTNTACSYFFFAHKVALINAHQRSDLTELVGGVVKTVTGIAQIIVIVLLQNIVLYVLLTIVCTVSYNLVCSAIANRKFNQYVCAGNVLPQIKTKIKKDIFALGIQKIGTTVSISLDVVIISAYLSLSMVAIYGNYLYIISSVSMFIVLIFNSITAGIGNSMAIESVNKNMQNFKTFVFLNQWILIWSSCCLVCILPLFVEVWLGKEFLLPTSVLFAMIFCFYVTQMRQVVQTYKNAGGIWWADKYKPIVGCIVNLVLNIILVQHIGIIGVVISTIVSYLVIEIPWETRVLFRLYFKVSQTSYYSSLLYMFASGIIATTITYLICATTVGGVLGILYKLGICIIVPNLIIALLCAKKTEMKNASILMLNVIKKR